MIETERLTLRNWREGDAEPFIAHTNTVGVMRWLGGIKSPEQLRQSIETLAEWQEERGFTLWAVERKADGALLGFCGLKIADDPGCPVQGQHEIAWRLREDAWGHGYAKEAASASLDFAFDRLGAEHVVAFTVEENAPSWGLMQRLGMTRRPELDYVGAEWAEGIVIAYQIARQDWRK